LSIILTNYDTIEHKKITYIYYAVDQILEKSRRNGNSEVSIEALEILSDMTKKIMCSTWIDETGLEAGIKIYTEVIDKL
jgi:hypothetical protein